MNDHDLKHALTDKQALTLTLWGEARGEPLDGKIAVASVIRNRVKAGQSYRAVCLAPFQFSCWNDGDDENHRKLMSLTRQLLMQEPARDTLQPTFLSCARVADQTIAGITADPTKGATHYVTIDLLNAHPPKWLSAMKLTRVIGNHAFFKEVEAA